MLCFISLWMVLLGMAAGLTREYKYFSMPMSWNDAQKNCKLNYKGLAVITTVEENQRLIDAEGARPSGWIGMNKSTSNTFIWVEEEENQISYFQWKHDEPNNIKGVENCVEFTQDGWNDCFCGTLLPFYCYRTLVLVNEKKTWEEADDYCRMKDTSLISLVSESQIQLAEIESNQAQTNSVWTGLRFLDGKWLWVSKDPVGELVSLPSCPAIDYRCGARNTKTHVLENRDCNEKLNFICHN